MQAGRWVGRIMVLAGLAWLTACASAPRAPAPLTVVVRLTATDDVNPDSTGRASPVVVRVYQLHDASSFGNAEFFALYDHEKETLAADLLGSAEYVLRPGETRDIQLQPDPTVLNFGFLAAFRDLPNAQWRASWQLPPRPRKPRKVPARVEVVLSRTSVAIGSTLPAGGH